MVAAVVGVAVPEDVADYEPNDEESIHDHEESRAEIESVLVVVAKHWYFEEVYEAFGEPNDEKAHDPLANGDSALVWPFLGENEDEDYYGEQHNINCEFNLDPLDFILNILLNYLLEGLFISKWLHRVGRPRAHRRWVIATLIIFLLLNLVQISLHRHQCNLLFFQLLHHGHLINTLLRSPTLLAPILRQVTSSAAITLAIVAVLVLLMHVRIPADFFEFFLLQPAHPLLTHALHQSIHSLRWLLLAAATALWGSWAGIVRGLLGRVWGGRRSGRCWEGGVEAWGVNFNKFLSARWLCEGGPRQAELGATRAISIEFGSVTAFAAADGGVHIAIKGKFRIFIECYERLLLSGWLLCADLLTQLILQKTVVLSVGRDSKCCFLLI